jgi:hypothetical protein
MRARSPTAHVTVHEVPFHLGSEREGVVLIEALLV